MAVPAILIAAGGSALLVPPLGSALIRRTYRTDPALLSLPVPASGSGARLAAVACSVTIVACAPAAGWSEISAIALGPLFAAALLTDAAARVLPDVLTASVAAAGVCLALAGTGLELTAAIAACAFLGGSISIFRRVVVRMHGPSAFCLGDVKLLAATALAVPLIQIAWALIAAGPIAVGLAHAQRRGARHSAAAGLPFGSLFVAGLALTLAVTACLAWAGAAPVLSSNPQALTEEMKYVESVS